MNPASVAGLWPIAGVLAAALLRLLEHWVLHDGPPGADLTRSGRLLVELLSVTSQAFVVGSGVGFALLWGAR